MKGKINKRKIYHLRKSIREVRKKRKRKHKRYIPINFINVPAFFYKKEKPDFAKILFPEKLVLDFENVCKVLRWIKYVKNVARKGSSIEFILDNVQEIGEGSIAMLLSVMTDLGSKGITFKGNKPRNQDAKDVLEKSGFFKHTTGKISPKNAINKNTILTTGNSKTKQVIIIPAIHSAMETVWGNKARCPSLYAGLAEMMRNSCDHAFENSKNVTWHLGVTHLEEENTVKFSFVDNGTGILKSYSKTRKGMFQQVMAIFKNNNSQILVSAFKNGIESVTGLPWRGKGLPTIFEMYDQNIITNLVVITNNVYLDFDKQNFQNIDARFNGTYYFWQINQKCEPQHLPMNQN